MALLGGHTREKNALQVLLFSRKREFISACHEVSFEPLRIASAYFKAGAPKVESYTLVSVQDDLWSLQRKYD